ncbi:hypothetical protein HR45_17395 [Shewanella mangrovi]|uniref:DUF2057 domain-containing protein n=1 Tax=Shewanella mangrovi TaxID=1515746 RepID=A0A094LME7_9GAMM|nr:DUF2057 family protein [Shewanella mangrovi]KFZ36278.1 hypothetical protein HR45_17395 [Shewanella mangrovi]
MFVSMTKTVIAASLVVSAIAAPLASAATLHVPDSIQISSIDGHAVNVFSTIKLDAGEHLITLKYRDYFNTYADDSGDWVNSNTLFGKINIGQQTEISLATPKILDVADARAFVQQPTLLQRDGQGNSQTIKLQSAYGVLANLLESH